MAERWYTGTPDSSTHARGYHYGVLHADRCAVCGRALQDDDLLLKPCSGCSLPMDAHDREPNCPVCRGLPGWLRVPGGEPVYVTAPTPEALAALLGQPAPVAPETAAAAPRPDDGPPTPDPAPPAPSLEAARQDDRIPAPVKPPRRRR